MSDTAKDIYGSRVLNDSENLGVESCNGTDCSIAKCGTLRTVQILE